MRKRKSLSLISITSHYLPFSRRSLQDTLTHTHTLAPTNTDTVLQCLLRLDRQLDTEIDGLLSKFKGGARGVQDIHTLCISVTCTLRLCSITLMVIQLRGELRVGRRRGARQREVKEGKQGQSSPCFTITVFPSESDGAYQHLGSHVEVPDKLIIGQT